MYLPPEALATLQMWEEKTKALERKRGTIIRRVFHRNGEPIRQFPYELWHRACGRAEIPGRRIPHDFRRTAARNYRRSGVTEGVIMKIGGWKTRSVFDRYDIENEDDLREAAAMVGAPIGKEMGKRASIRPLRRSKKAANAS